MSSNYLFIIILFTFVAIMGLFLYHTLSARIEHMCYVNNGSSGSSSSDIALRGLVNVVGELDSRISALERQCCRMNGGGAGSAGLGACMVNPSCAVRCPVGSDGRLRVETKDDQSDTSNDDDENTVEDVASESESEDEGDDYDDSESDEEGDEDALSSSYSLPGVLPSSTYEDENEDTDADGDGDESVDEDEYGDENTNTNEDGEEQEIIFDDEDDDDNLDVKCGNSNADKLNKFSIVNNMMAFSPHVIHGFLDPKNMSCLMSMGMMNMNAVGGAGVHSQPMCFMSGDGNTTMSFQSFEIEMDGEEGESSPAPRFEVLDTDGDEVEVQMLDGEDADAEQGHEIEMEVEMEQDGDVDANRYKNMVLSNVQITNLFDNGNPPPDVILELNQVLNGHGQSNATSKTEVEVDATEGEVKAEESEVPAQVQSEELEIELHSFPDPDVSQEGVDDVAVEEGNAVVSGEETAKKESGEGEEATAAAVSAAKGDYEGMTMKQLRELVAVMKPKKNVNKMKRDELVEFLTNSVIV